MIGVVILLSSRVSFKTARSCCDTISWVVSVWLIQLKTKSWKRQTLLTVPHVLLGPSCNRQTDPAPHFEVKTENLFAACLSEISKTELEGSSSRTSVSEGQGVMLINNFNIIRKARLPPWLQFKKLRVSHLKRKCHKFTSQLLPWFSFALNSMGSCSFWHPTGLVLEQGVLKPTCSTQ